MLTVGRRYQGRKRNWNSTCDVCGVLWPRNQLRLDAQYGLLCPDDSPGRVEIELDMIRASDASQPSQVVTRTKR